MPNGEKAAVFVYPLVHKQDNTKNYFDTRDSGAYERGVTWNYAITNNMKYFCIGVNDTVDKYNDYSFSLKTMYAYIDRSGSLYDTECLSLFGTNSFNLVWEKICAEIMDNQLDVPLGILKLPVPLKEDYNRRQKLIELIEKPLWTITGKCAKDTLIPDLVSICKVNDQHQFIIFDAKYYNAHLEKGIVPTGQPGIESITKQYLYQLAYQQFIEDHNFSSVKNCFLLPTENNEIEDKGEVRMEMLSNLGLQDIKIRLIPATMAYDLYLSGSKMDMERLDL